MGETLYFGLDGGGTGTRARLTDAEGRKLSEAEAGVGGIGTSDGAPAHASILEAARLCVKRAGLPPEAIHDLVAGLGLSGAPMRGAPSGGSISSARLSCMKLPKKAAPVHVATFAEDDAFGRRIHDAELAYTLSSAAARTALAENYVGLPF